MPNTVAMNKYTSGTMAKINKPELNNKEKQTKTHYRLIKGFQNIANFIYSIQSCVIKNIMMFEINYTKFSKTSIIFSITEYLH